MTEVEKSKLGGPIEVQTAWKVLAGGSPVAAQALVDIAAKGKSETARVMASTAILDRVGLAPPKEVHYRVVPVEMEDHPTIGQLSPAEVIRKRLKDLQAPTQALVQGVDPEQLAGMYGEANGPEVVDAELVPMPLDEAQDDDTWGNPWGG